MQARFISLSKEVGRRPAARWSLVGLALVLAIFLLAGRGPQSKIQLAAVPLLPTQSPTPSSTSTPLVVSSADSEEQPTWTSTATPRRATALAMTLQAQLDLTQTRTGSPTPLYTTTRTGTITPTWFVKTFPTVALPTWPTFTFTPRPTLTPLPTRNLHETQVKLHGIQTATARIGKTRTATAMVGNDIMVAQVDNPDSPEVVLSASSSLPLVVNANWMDDTKLYFEGHVSDRRRIYTLQLPGGSPLEMAGQNSQLQKGNPPKNNKDNLQPALSPNGNWIAFSSIPVDDRPRHHLFIMKTDGSKLYQLTKGIYNEELQPSWSPDGKKIIFISVQYGYYARIFSLDVDWLGADKHTPIDIYESQTPIIDMYTINIETPPRYCMDTSRPKWIAFSAREGYGGRQIYLMKPDGSNLFRLTKDYGNSFPDWSADCDKLIFVEDQELPEIYTLDMSWLFESTLVIPSKVNPQLLIASDAGKVYSPHFSPDGSQVVYIHRN